MKKIILIIQLSSLLNIFYAQERKIEEIEIIHHRTPIKVIELVYKNFENNYLKQDTLTFYTQFSNKEEKLGKIYELEGNVDLIFNNYLDIPNNIYDSFIYEDAKYVNNQHLLRKGEEHIITYFREYIAPNIIYKISKKRNQYNFLFMKTDNKDIYQIKFSPKTPRSFTYEGSLMIDKKTFAVLDFFIELKENKGNRFRTIWGTRKDSYKVLSHKLSCIFEKNNSDFYRISGCNTEVILHQEDNFYRKYTIKGSIKGVETPLGVKRYLFMTDGFRKEQK